MTGTVHLNTYQSVWWFLLFPPIAAAVIAGLGFGFLSLLRRIEARFQARIDCALAHPTRFDQDGMPHSDPNGCACEACLALVAWVRALLGHDDWDDAAQIELADGAL